MSSTIPTKAFALLSGGLDSTVALARADEEHQRRNVVAVSVDYGQRHIKELQRAAMIASYYNIPHILLKIEDMPKSMLTDPNMAIPNSSYADLPEGVSPTYVPFRNGQLLSKIAALASMHDGPSMIYAGMHAEDAERDAYPDCNMAFLGAMAAAIYVGTYHKVRLNIPFVSCTKAQIVHEGERLDAPMHLTWSCYAGDELHCGICPTCRARRDAFQLAHVSDPTSYANVPEMA